MTLNTTVDRTITGGTGSLTIFPYNFKITDSDQLEVIRSNKVAPLNKVTLNEGADYTVSGVDEAAGGNITLAGAQAASPPTTDEQIACLRKLPLIQGVNIRNQGGFKGNTVEGRCDYLTGLIQQIWGTVLRCLKVDEVSNEDPDTLVHESFAATAPLDTSNFNGALSAADATVQEAFDTLDDEVDLKAPISSPVFTDDPEVPTPSSDDNSTLIANTAFVKAVGLLPLDENATGSALPYFDLDVSGSGRSRFHVSIDGLECDTHNAYLLMRFGTASGLIADPVYTYIGHGYTVEGTPAELIWGSALQTALLLMPTTHGHYQTNPSFSIFGYLDIWNEMPNRIGYHGRLSWGRGNKSTTGYLASADLSGAAYVSPAESLEKVRLYASSGTVSIGGSNRAWGFNRWGF